MRQNIFRILAAVAIITLIGVSIILANRPDPTPQELVESNPYFTFTMKGRVRSVHPMMAEWHFQDNDITKAPLRENIVKYSVVINVKSANDVKPTNPAIHHSIDLPAPGDHTITVVEDSALTMIDLGSAEEIIRRPINSTGLRIYPTNTRSWVDDWDVTLFCWEEVGSSGNPEHVCRLF